MNVDLYNALVTAAQAGVNALRHDALPAERHTARRLLEDALLNMRIAAAATKQTDPEFDGPTYDPEQDKNRLSSQLGRVYDCMRDHKWRTLDEIQAATKDPAASISAQLRHLRKPRFGTYRVEKRHRGDPEQGLFEYRVLPPDGRIEHEIPDMSDLKGVAGEFKQPEIL